MDNSERTIELKTNQDRVLRTMQEIELEGLKEIDRICRKHGIKYSLGGGTCLGQLRHGGFIPWDDDIDIDMTAENYDRFMEVVFDEMDQERFFLRCRKTDPTHYRTASRFEIKGTELSIPMWNKKNPEGNTRVFVDIFRWNFLPDDEKKRKKIATRLFYLRCLQHYKEYHRIAAKLPLRLHFWMRIFGRIISRKSIERQEEKLVHFCGGEKTGWIMDDSIIHGDYGGYPADGVDEYEDVQFEGLTVMNKKNPHNFMRTIYGEHYMEWLPPAKRISHHTWSRIDFGEFEKLYNIDPSYHESMTTGYSEAKLRRMKVVSDEMVADISSLLKAHGLNFAIAAPDPEAYTEEPFEGMKELWDGPAIIMMPREDYDAFAEVCKTDLPKKYFYQSFETDPEYPLFHARIRLNLTKIREKQIKARYESLYNNGFYIKILPFDGLPEDEAARKDHIRKIQRLNNRLIVKTKADSLESFRKMTLKNKVKTILLMSRDRSDIMRELDELAHQYKVKDDGECFDSSCQLGTMQIKKEELTGGKMLPIIHKGIFGVSEIEKFIKRVEKRYGPCYLTYYDYEDRQLSVLRYDEKTGRYLTNEELLNMTS